MIRSLAFILSLVIPTKEVFAACAAVLATDSSRVSKAGDTMTGALTMSGASSYITSGSSISTKGGLFGDGGGITNLAASGWNDDGTVVRLLTSSDKVGIGTTIPFAVLDVEGAAQFGSGSTKSTFTAAGNLLVPGNVGVGDASPATTLVVAGDGWFQNAIKIRGTEGAANPANAIEIGTGLDLAWTDVAEIRSVGNMTLSPASGHLLLSPDGEINLTADADLNGSGTINFKTNSSDRGIVTNGGLWGINTMAPSITLTVNGASQFGSGITKSTFSTTGQLTMDANASIQAGTTFYVGGGSVGMGTTAPNALAVLDLTSTAKTFLPPRMTTAQRDAIIAPPSGSIIWNTTTAKANHYNGSAWEEIASSSTSVTSNILIASATATQAISASTGWNAVTGSSVTITIADQRRVRVQGVLTAEAGSSGTTYFRARVQRGTVDLGGTNGNCSAAFDGSGRLTGCAFHITTAPLAAGDYTFSLMINPESAAFTIDPSKMPWQIEVEELK